MNPPTIDPELEGLYLAAMEDASVIPILADWLEDHGSMEAAEIARESLDRSGHSFLNAMRAVRKHLGGMFGYLEDSDRYPKVWRRIDGGEVEVTQVVTIPVDMKKVDHPDKWRFVGLVTECIRIHPISRMDFQGVFPVAFPRHAASYIMNV